MTPNAQDASRIMDDITVRTFQPDDQSAVITLYNQGLLAGQVTPNDTGADIEYIHDAYFDSDRHHFWVATQHDHIVGMIGVASDDDHTAEIRRLRVQPDLQSTPIAAKLLATALEHCKTHGFLKIRLDTRFERDEAVGLFDKLGFQHTRTKNVQGKDLLEFYLDIYRQDQSNDD
ncbi:Acetyltransferase YpeA [Poriferisphaera corsica]|uniref:Acetyltransferase YpeA n=1 Tax=Poriferisphaera corsica TaxID=2528020 RepID=A0A517YVX7_9BACT|nr:GNAT family N-acetyltransferase [Poriferisphaera corsica]QDU34376.1 Acetyltransferase YpeA [Poriferisphaera corsica]